MGRYRIGIRDDLRQAGAWPEPVKSRPESVPRKVYAVSESLQARIAALSLPDVGLNLAEAGVRIRAVASEGRAVVELTPGFPCATLRPWLEAEVARAAQAEGLALARLELVTREEYDVQVQVLARTREKVAALEARVAVLEAQAAARTP